MKKSRGVGARGFGNRMKKKVEGFVLGVLETE